MSYTAKLVKNGNIKIGNSMWSWNKLAGAGEISGCKGSCGKHCKGCYDPENPRKSPCYVFKSYVQYGWDKSTVVKSHIQNTRIMREDPKRAFKEINLQITRAKKKPSAIRIHASGELESASELQGWVDVAKNHPGIMFYLYTKNYEAVDKVLNKEKELPKNFFINISIWHNIGIKCYEKWKQIKNIRAFVYDDGVGLKVKPDCYCPAYDKKGKLHHDITCDKCKICFQEKAKICACYAH